jgi:membrane-bound metal-dependent hydrolase YbcI (DUF457 family)
VPVTTYHLGPGILVKALLRGSFSLMVFAWTQLVMDVQPVVVAMTGKGQPHGFTHTYVGATLLAVLSGFTGKYLADLVLRLVPAARRAVMSVPWRVAFISGFIGAYSHVLIDSVVHPEMQPFAPFSAANSLAGVLSGSALQSLCVYSGLVGTVLYFAVTYLQSRRGRRADPPSKES